MLSGKQASCQLASPQFRDKTARPGDVDLTGCHDHGGSVHVGHAGDYARGVAAPNARLDDVESLQRRIRAGAVRRVGGLLELMVRNHETDRAIVR